MFLVLRFQLSFPLQVHDYRKCTSEQGPAGSALDSSPTVNKVLLRMSLENIVKDMPLISDDTWTYSDLMVSTVAL